MIDQVDHTHLAVNLDVEHATHKKFYQPFGGFRQMVEHIGPRLAHCHIHDSDLTNDHIEIGIGAGDFDVIMENLAAVNYPSFFAMEPNPDWVSRKRHCARARSIKGKNPTGLKG
ncbi:MAG: TIM barrel protein [Chloroflexota bacterium]